MIAGDLSINEVTEQLIRDFKTEVKEMHKAVHKANRKAILESINDPAATCIWDPDDADADTGPPPEPTIQQEATSTNPT